MNRLKPSRLPVALRVLSAETDRLQVQLQLRQASGSEKEAPPLLEGTVADTLELRGAYEHASWNLSAVVKLNQIQRIELAPDE